MKISVISIGYRYCSYYYSLLPIFMIEENAKFHLKFSKSSVKFTDHLNSLHLGGPWTLG